MIGQSKFADIEFAGISEAGSVRAENQDAIMLPDTFVPGTFAFLVGLADGIGGFSCGEIASKLALTTFRQAILDSKENVTEKLLRKAMEIANIRVYRTAREMDVGRMGTTLTTGYILGDQLFLAHIGDSRAYIVQNEQIICVSNDHTIAGDMVRSRQILPEMVRQHEQRSVLTRAIGLEIFINPDISSHKLFSGDRLVFCSDGVWSVVEEKEILTLTFKNKSPMDFIFALIQTAQKNLSDDDCSAITVDIQAFLPLMVPASVPTQRKWFGIFENK